jgi:hypothetical protein
MTTYCAQCLADLALLRGAVTSVSGTAACVAHAVLLTHPGDTPQRRLERLSDLRSMAESKLATASPQDVPGIEELIQEYALAGAMDMSVPLKELAGDRTPRPPKPRRNRGRDRDRPAGDRPAGDRGPRPSADSATPAAAPVAEAAPAPVAEAAPAPVAEVAPAAVVEAPAVQSATVAPPVESAPQPE